MGIGPNEKVRIGIIGCGGIANGKHMPALSKLQNAEMVAFCDIVLERAEKAAKEYGVEGAKEMGVIYGTGVYEKGEIKDKKAMLEAYEMGKGIV